MFKTINVLAKAMELGSFDVATLAASSGVTPATVQTVINRAPCGWFEQARIATGARGGQPVEYTLTPEGRGGISEQLGRLPEMPTLKIRERPTNAAPLGLKSALLTLAKLRAEPSIDVAKYLIRIRRNLDWADRELMNSPASIDNSKHRLQLEVARGYVEAREALARRSPSEALVPLLSGRVHRPDEVSRARARVWIGCLGDDEDVLRMARSARTAVSAAHVARSFGVPHPLEIGDIDLELGSPELIERLREILAVSVVDASPSADMFVCVNSRRNPDRLLRTLDDLATVIGTCPATVLDYGESEALARYALTSPFDYQPHAEKDLSWLANALLRGS
ncbi:MAG: hypothetical protein WBF89_02720 [Steroidobacteraceae bacterium]